MTRRFVRVEPSLRQPIAVSILVPGLPTYTTAALEVSRRGVALLGTGILSPGQTYAFLIQLPDPSAVIACYGSVRSKRERDDGFRYGVELQVHPKDEELMCRYIMNREREIAGLAREL
jgi:c-di-GMP-binding flagellar brake protein YcgR